MTGPEHYREAERLVQRAAALNPQNNGTVAELMALAALAQVHAMLADAAATAQAALVNSDHFCGMNPADVKAWDAAAGTKE